MRVLRKAGIPVLLTFFLVGCGDTFRPVANPISQPVPDPQFFKYAISINQGSAAGPCTDGLPTPCQGSTDQIDVSGDTDISERTVGRAPVHGALSPSGVVFTANPGDNSVSQFNTANAAVPATTISLTPSGGPAAIPVYVHSTEAANFYAADFGNDTVAVISQFQNLVTAELPLAPSSGPVALAETPDATKLLVINQGSSDVTVIGTSDHKTIATIPLGHTPFTPGANLPGVAAMNSDGLSAYVLNNDSTVSVIDVAHNAVLGAISVGAGANFMVFDTNLRRLYVTNPGSGTVSVYDANPSPPSLPNLLATVILPGLSGAPVPVSVTALPDGTRFYVADSESTGCVGEAGVGRVYVFNASGNTFKSCVTVGVNPVSLTASASSAKVLVANHGTPPSTGGSITDIRTADDTVVATIPVGVPAVPPAIAPSVAFPILVIPSR